MINIGVFDSGIGGLWILKHLQSELPQNNYIFFADQGHVPYGSRPMEEIRDFSEKISQFLIGKNCKIIVIACNTASAAALLYLRAKFPDVFFVGMEPAVKPAVETTHTKKVGVLATPATFQGDLYNSVVERFASDVEIFQNTCPGLVEQIEKGEFSSEKTKKILNEAIIPMLKDGIDTIVLGCTHYPFVIPRIKELAGDNVTVIDPTPAIVRQVSHLLIENNLASQKKESREIEVFTTGEDKMMNNIFEKLFNFKTEAKKIRWGDELELLS